MGNLNNSSLFLMRTGNSMDRLRVYAISLYKGKKTFWVPDGCVMYLFLVRSFVRSILSHIFKLKRRIFTTFDLSNRQGKISNGYLFFNGSKEMSGSDLLMAVLLGDFCQG